MATTKKSGANQAWVCTKCAHRYCGITKPQPYGCTKSTNKLHTWRKA